MLLAFASCSRVLLCLALATEPEWPSSAEMGNHRVLIHLGDTARAAAAAAGSKAVWADVPWQRRSIPAPNTTNVVLTVASTGAIVPNVLRAPVPGAASSREALAFVFEPQPAAAEVRWLPNTGTSASDSIVTNCSGAQRPTLGCWKAADGKLLFRDTAAATDEGWDGKLDAGLGNGTTEWIEFDLGSAAAAAHAVDRVALYSVAQSEDPTWFPQHNPAAVVLRHGDGPGGPWHAPLFQGVLQPPNASAADGGSFLAGWAGVAGRRYWRLEIASRHASAGGAGPVASSSHSYVKEVRFGVATRAPGGLEPLYALYHMPFTRSGSTTGLTLHDKYDPVAPTAAAAWRDACGLTDEALASGDFRGRFPQARFNGTGARRAFDAFDEMERPATRAAVQAMLAKHTAAAAAAAAAAPNPAAVLFFPTERTRQTRMWDEIPQLWAERGPGLELSGTAQPGELFALQAGVWAPDGRALRIAPEDVSWTALAPVAAAGSSSSSSSSSSSGGSSGSGGGAAMAIAASNMTCYNTRGRDFRGAPFAQDATVAAGAVGALWFGVAVPADQAPGVYSGEVTVRVALNGTTAGGGIEMFNTTLRVALTVAAAPPLVGGGVDNATGMSRLGWLDSTLGIDRNTTSDGAKRLPGLTLATDGATGAVTVHIGGAWKQLVVARSLGGDSVQVAQQITVAQPSALATPLLLDVLSAPVAFAADGARWKASGAPQVLQQDAMGAVLSTISASADGSLALNATLTVSFDGFIDIELALTLLPSASSSSRQLANTSMSFGVAAAASTFFMGLGVQGKNRSVAYPAGVVLPWKRNVGGENQLWAGSTTAGLRFKLKGDDPDWESPLHAQTAAPPSWGGDGAGGVVAALPSGDSGDLGISAWSGPVTLWPATPLRYKSDLLVTPVKHLDTGRHFRRDRYYQYGYNGHDDCETIGAMGVKVLNLHQGVDLNPYINYPFAPDAMAKQANFSGRCKALGVVATKIYYTTRELSNRCHELPTLQALGTPADHVYDAGTGGGGAWLQEHLQGGYHVRWSSDLHDGTGAIDEAIADTSLSRWVNYYISGLQWLSSPHADVPDSAAIDGLYLDELSFDRNTMMRLRKAVDRHRAGAMFDLHSCNKFNCGTPAMHACSALLYMAHMVFLDLLWFGESFSPDYPPDQWLVEMSGIPFGMHAEQLSSPNLWRGMVFGEGARPAPDLWKAWDALGLTADGVRLVGWWDDAPAVRSNDTSRTGVFASAYLRPSGGGVLAVASWDEKLPTTVELELVWAAFGLTAGTANVSASPIGGGFQPALQLDAARLVVTVPAKKGWLLDVSSISARDE
jgi:hypothetical protein